MCVCVCVCVCNSMFISVSKNTVLTMGPVLCEMPV